MENSRQSDQYISSEIKAALHARCPKCRRGKMFAESTFAGYGQKMNKDCPYCGFHFEIEPGYFYVAMFVSYAMDVAIMVTVAVATYVLSGSLNPWVYIVATLLPIFLLSPMIYKYSRVILLFWLTPNLHFDPERSKDDYAGFKRQPER
ncbi:DUF983 domain-containing protein [Mucilaginibacter pallidiroseus]|uniref:DUF983 domain-containing protein n=1 Tax=Mucilaginibacter pallidiroseus TaxID=2599295 RepID=A0A563U0L8_9SPHI|nr:DUF983 domain-containing protein [Mucilaginibacter pallidiroseus]TWR24411.1 DUF983 domain-containing protein [Mucilaginibacter pallidiroseus]